MNGNKQYLLDTNVVISILAGKLSFSALNSDPLIAISVITEIELLSFHRLSTHEESIIKTFLADADIVYLNPLIKDIAISLRKKHGIKIPDAIIVASALHRNAILVTDDRVLLRLKGSNSISTAHFSETLV